MLGQMKAIVLRMSTKANLLLFRARSFDALQYRGLAYILYEDLEETRKACCQSYMSAVNPEATQIPRSGVKMHRSGGLLLQGLCFASK